MLFLPVGGISYFVIDFLALPMVLLHFLSGKAQFRISHIIISFFISLFLIITFAIDFNDGILVNASIKVTSFFISLYALKNVLAWDFNKDRANHLSIFIFYICWSLSYYFLGYPIEICLAYPLFPIFILNHERYKFLVLNFLGILAYFVSSRFLFILVIIKALSIKKYGFLITLLAILMFSYIAITTGILVDASDVGRSELLRYYSLITSFEYGLDRFFFGGNVNSWLEQLPNYSYADNYTPHSLLEYFAVEFGLLSAIFLFIWVVWKMGFNSSLLIVMLVFNLQPFSGLGRLIYLITFMLILSFSNKDLYKKS